MNKRKESIKASVVKANRKEAERKLALYERALAGDSDAIVQCSYESEMITKDDYEDWFETKKFVEKMREI